MKDFCHVCCVVYASNSLVLRRTLRKDTVYIWMPFNGPILMIGDFNCIMFSNKRVGILFSATPARDFSGCMEA